MLYSTSLANITNATTAGGALVTFGNNAGEATATVGTKTVKIVQADILTKNGVIHLVDGIFDPSNSTATFPLPNSNNAVEYLPFEWSCHTTHSTLPASVMV